MGPALAFMLLGPLAWLAVATRVLVRVPPEDTPQRTAGMRATAVWITGMVTCALVLGAWEPPYRAPTPPADRRLPADGVPTATTAWTAKIANGDGNTCSLLSFSPAVDASGMVYVPLRGRVVAVSGEGEVMWERADRPTGAPRARPGGGVYVVTDGVTGADEPRAGGGARHLVEVLPDGSTGASWPYVETPLHRPDGGFYSRTWDHLVAVGPDGQEEWRTAIPHGGRLGAPLYDAGGNLLVPAVSDGRIHVVTPDGEVAGTLSGIDTEPPQSWMPGPYPAPGPGGSLVSWDGDLVAVRLAGDTVWRRGGYEPRVAAAPDGSLRAVHTVDRGEIFLVRLDRPGLPTWRHPLVPADRGWAWVSAGPVVGEDGATLLVVRGDVGRAIAIDDDGMLRWISEPLPGVEERPGAAWGPRGRAYVVRRIHERGACAAVVALERVTPSTR